MIIMIDIRQSFGEQAVESLNNEFGRKRAVFLRCDVTNNSEFDGKYITSPYHVNLYFAYIRRKLECCLLAIYLRCKLFVNYLSVYIYIQFLHSMDNCSKLKILIVAATFKEAINILGGLDILINNAGVINETDFSEAIDVNVVSFYF